MSDETNTVRADAAASRAPKVDEAFDWQNLRNVLTCVSQIFNGWRGYEEWSTFDEETAQAVVAIQRAIDIPIQLAAGARAVPSANRKAIMIDRDAIMRGELRAYLDTRAITGETIGDIRRSLFVPWESQWNGWVRDETAQREGKPACAVPETQEGREVAAYRAFVDFVRVPATGGQTISRITKALAVLHCALEEIARPRPAVPVQDAPPCRQEMR